MKKGIILLLALILITACNSEKKEVIKIGVIAPLTGEGASYGEAMKRGADLVFDNKDEIELIFEDSKLTAKEGITAIQKLISTDKVKIVYGAAASSVTLAIAPIAEKQKVILFSSISTADDIKNSGDFIFRNVPRNEIQGKTAADFLVNKLEKKEIGILFENDDYGINLSNSFKERIIELGGVVLVSETYLSGDTNFKTQLLKLKRQNAQALFIPGNYAESALILKQAKEMNFNVPIIGGDGSYSPELIKNAGASAENFYCTIMSVDKKSSYYKNFFKIFYAKYQIEPNIYDAYAYEANMIIYEALKNVGNNSAKVKEYLLNNVFNSLTGELDFDDFGEVIRSYGIVIVMDDKFTEVEF